MTQEERITSLEKNVAVLEKQLQEQPKGITQIFQVYYDGDPDSEVGKALKLLSFEQKQIKA